MSDAERAVQGSDTFLHGLQANAASFSLVGGVIPLAVVLDI